MFIGIVLLTGMMKIFFAMEPIPAAVDNNPFVSNVPGSFIQGGSACIPILPTAPCDRCVQIDEIIQILKNKNVYFAVFYFFNNHF